MNTVAKKSLCWGTMVLVACVTYTDTVLSQTNRGVRRLEVQHEPLVAKMTSGDELKLYDKSYALIIGVSDYDRWNKLPNIPSELDSVEETLIKEGFSIIRLSNPDAAELREAVSDFIGKYGYDLDNRLLLYYSGHGHSDDQQGYLVPRDAPSPGLDEGAFYQKAIAMSEVRSWAERMKAKHALFVFDSCFSGTVFSRIGVSSANNYIRRMTSKGARQFITAGAANQEVPARSIFTPLFVSALSERKADFSRDGYVTAQELGLYLSEEVPRLSQQNPQFGSLPSLRYSEGNVVFFGDKTRIKKPVEPVLIEQDVIGTVLEYENIAAPQATSNGLAEINYDKDGLARFLAILLPDKLERDELEREEVEPEKPVRDEPKKEGSADEYHSDRDEVGLNLFLNKLGID